MKGFTRHKIEGGIIAYVKNFNWDDPKVEESSVTQENLKDILYSLPKAPASSYIYTDPQTGVKLIRLFKTRRMIRKLKVTKFRSRNKPRLVADYRSMYDGLSNKKVKVLRPQYVRWFKKYSEDMAL